jgi:ABC-type phosphate transport system substrate-binding protein
MLLLREAAAEESPPAFVIVVNPENSVQVLSREFLTDAFLKQRTRWDDDQALKPVDLTPNSHAREKFSEDVLHRSVAAVKSYWQQRIFSGRGVPPPELESDEAVLAYVLKHRGAVGYVSGRASLGKVKAVTIR